MAFGIKITQLTLERNFGEAIRLLQARQTQFHFASEIDKGTNQLFLAGTQRLAGDTASAKATAEQARTVLEPLRKDQPDNASFAALLAVSYACARPEGLSPQGSGTCNYTFAER